MPIPRPYQLSNGIFVPINIENGHGRLCPLFWGCTLLLLICGHIYIQTSSALQCQNHISNIYFVEVWQENGEEAYQKVPLENISECYLLKCHLQIEIWTDWVHCRVERVGFGEWEGSRYKLTAGAFRQKLIKKGEMLLIRVRSVLNFKWCSLHLKALWTELN